MSSVFLPILVGIVTKQVAHPALTSILLALFSAANGVVSSAILDHGIITKATLSAAFISWVVAVASYYGFLRPTGVAPAVQEKTADFGVG